MAIDLFTDEIDDAKIQENFIKIKQFLNLNPLTNGNFKFYKVSVNQPSTTYRFYHDLGFVPRDAIITYISSGSVTPIYNSFNKSYIELNISNECEFRMLLGFIPLEGVGS